MLRRFINEPYPLLILTGSFSILQSATEYPKIVASRSTIKLKEFDNFVLCIAYSWGNG